MHFTLLVADPDVLPALAALTQYLDLPLTPARKASVEELSTQLSNSFRQRPWAEVRLTAHRDWKGQGLLPS